MDSLVQKTSNARPPFQIYLYNILIILTYYLQSSGKKQISYFCKKQKYFMTEYMRCFLLFLCKYCCECCWNICRGGTCGSHWEEYDVSLQIYTMEYCYQLPTSQFMATYNSLSQFGSDVTGNFVSCVDVV